MRKRPILKKYQKFSEILKITSKNKFSDWTIENLDKVLKTLKKSQSPDSMGLVNELFMQENIGEDLKISLLHLFNKIKNSNQIPHFFKNVYITAIPKKKRLSLDLVDQRGVFLVPKLRSLFLKLIYFSIIDTVEENLSLSNIGARKNKSPKDHLFVLYSVLHETLNEKEASDLDLVFYDLAQAYDSLWVSHTLVDLYENKIDSNLLNIIYELSKNATISIKTPVGISEEKEIDETIMQGETVSSILCTSSVDKVAKDSPLPALRYKKEVEIPKLGFVDDMLDINKCGKETKDMNNYTTTEINKRRLQFSADKCVQMHIKSKSPSNKGDCEKLYIDGWKEENV